MLKLKHYSLILVVLAFNISVEAKKKKETWQQAVAEVSAQLQADRQSAEDRHKKETERFNILLENLQARLNKEIESIAAQVQEIQDSLNASQEKQPQTS